MKKFILLASLATVLGFTSYTQAEDTSQPKTEVAKVDVISTLEGKTQILKDGKYIPTSVNKDTEYFVVYYTASW